jgi:hypothetical protein
MMSKIDWAFPFLFLKRRFGSFFFCFLFLFLFFFLIQHTEYRIQNDRMVDAQVLV